ncbi:DUF3231 family protein [Halalkalibacter alkalisediminis]|uniref:DUF3231 family protein n=1 Tax=Halalkalibacter alkalisediminis TaxID=935616 RepID=A0ABV6NJ48_9BACI|nr:DUF3231 family protein [Halalkalibacter alkalisediminis]
MRWIMNTPNMTASEIGILWTQYLQNSMSLQIVKYFNEIVEDTDIRLIVEQTLQLTGKVNSEIEQFFQVENIPTPDAFSESDVNLKAPRLYTDPFILWFIETMGKASSTAYSLSQGVSSRTDIRAFFSKILMEYSSLLNEAIDMGLTKGIYVRPPSITKPGQVEYITGKKYFSSGLNPFNKRTLNSVEIMHLSENLKTNAIGTLLCTGFAQTTENKEVKKFFIDGKNISNKHVKIFSEKLSETGLTAAISPDIGVTDSTTRVFSDKLMMFLKSVLSATGQGNYSTASTASMRYDLVADYQRLSAEIALYAKDGLDIMLKHGWLEEPPQAPDRKELIHSK